MNDTVYDAFAAGHVIAREDGLDRQRRLIQAFYRAGYDYVTLPASDFGFPSPARARAKSISQSGHGVIANRVDFQNYPWPDPDCFDYTRLITLAPELPAGMQFVTNGPGGVLENIITLLGYETLCLMTAEEPDLLDEICAAVGSRILRHYERCLEIPAVGAVIVNDDWGFAQQTMLSPADMRRYIIPWHRKMVQAIHAAGRPAILHACGNLREVMEDIITDLRYDGKHSYEDKILPVEEAYEQYGGRIAILGGFDLDFICRSTPEQIQARVRAMLARTKGRGGFAIGTGNSVPDYVPLENYLAMINCAFET
jgi:uroporphyrinogen decarboxylase